MRKQKTFYFFYILIIFILCTCNDPVFYAISTEIKPIEPRIKGVPTNFAEYNERMYVASGSSLYSYKYDTVNPGNSWKSDPNPGGPILKIASTAKYLYALCATDKNYNGSFVLKRFDKDNPTWTQIGGLNYPKMQTIFAAGNVLFISAVTSTSNFNYTILYLEDSGSTASKITTDHNQDDTGLLTGAAAKGTTYFLSFKESKGSIKNGVYKITTLGTASTITGNAIFNGIINLGNSGNTILLISRDGDVYTVDTTIDKTSGVSMNRYSTGALAIYSNGTEKLLLAGSQDSLNYSSSGYGNSYGYMELELDITGIKSGANFTEPGRSSSSTLDNYERYRSSMGKNPVNYIFQAPSDIDSKMTLFASTQQKGVWSLRDRDNNNNKYWNSEGENEP